MEIYYYLIYTYVSKNLKLLNHELEPINNTVGNITYTYMELS